MINVKEVGRQEPEAGSEYPCLKINEEYRIVLFTSHKRGMILKNGNGTQITIGYFADTWIEDDFVPYAGTLEISNAQ